MKNTMNEDIERFFKAGGKVQQIPDGVGEGYKHRKSCMASQEFRDGVRAEGRDSGFTHDGTRPKRFGKI